MSNKFTDDDTESEYVEGFAINCDCGGALFELYLTADRKLEAKCIECDGFVDLAMELDS